MSRADFRKEGILNEANLQIIYQNKKKIINTLLKITSVSEFISVFDDDQDGFLNEDEQIMVFTIIAKRIQIIAEELCYLKTYELYKDLMKEVRLIESQINKYQNELRQNVHKKQLDNYINIGKEIQDEFNQNWDMKMMTFQKKSQNTIEEYKSELKSQIDEKQRILENDGRIQPFVEDGEFVGPERIWIKEEEVPGLAMTRSFGDRVAATVGVISEPEIKEMELNINDKFMIIASDGICRLYTYKDTLYPALR